MNTRQLHSFADADAALQPYIPIVKETIGKDITLDRMRLLMDILGNPQTKLKVIHVAGTSGKTSTAYYIAGLLKAAGQTVGLTVSPHIDVISERIQINLVPLPEAVFCKVLSEFLELIEGITPKPSYFELLMAMAYWYFAKVGVSYAVVETGVGGLHDASNICKNTNKICVLTDIGFDHMHIFGHTLPEISSQKAGIMHQGSRALTFKQPPEVMETFLGYAQNVGAELEVVSEVDESGVVVDSQTFKDLPYFQQRNWLLAHAVYELLGGRDKLTELTSQQLEASMLTYVPGRMDSQKVNSTTILMDGAHNEQKMEAFVRSFRKIYPGQQVPVLLGLKGNKDYQAVLPLLKPITSKLIITKFMINQDLQSKTIDPEIIAEQARKDGFDNVVVESDQHAALTMLLKGNHELVLVTGSFYLLSNIRRLVRENEK